MEKVDKILKTFYNQYEINFGKVKKQIYKGGIFYENNHTRKIKKR